MPIKLYIRPTISARSRRCTAPARPSRWHARPQRRADGRSVEQMAEADAVIFAPSWKDARGCRCERIIAAEYGLRILDAQPRG